MAKTVLEEAERQRQERVCDVERLEKEGKQGAEVQRQARSNKGHHDQHDEIIRDLIAAGN
jgi:hypothetical protein